MITTLGDWKIEIGPKDDSALYVQQVHGNTIVRAEDIVSNKTEADGIFVENFDQTVGVGFADCMPLVLVGKGSAAILHVSRKTLVAGLLDSVPAFIDPKNIAHVYIGPHICERHFTFEWEGEGIATFSRHFPYAVDERGGPIHLSLQKVVEDYLHKWGVSDNAIAQDDRCTYETASLPSWKRHYEEGKDQNTLQIFVATVHTD